MPRSGETSLDQISFDEHRENLNILYVAATRATKELVLNVDLFYLLYKMCRVRNRNGKRRKETHRKKTSLRNRFIVSRFLRMIFDVAVVRLTLIKRQQWRRIKKFFFNFNRFNYHLFVCLFVMTSSFETFVTFFFQNIRTAGDFSPLPICVKHLPSSFISICQLYHSI